MIAISANGLTKRYGRAAAVSDLSFEVTQGEIVGFLGPNGAGKTTTLRMLAGLVKPSAGTCTVLGAAVPGPTLRRVGTMIEEPSFYPYLTGRDNLTHAALLHGDVPRSRVDEVLEFVQLQDAARKRVRAYSQGMRQRLALARALLWRPQVLLLDEPTNGLDPQGREEMLELIRSISHGKGVNVLVSSHLLKDIERTCDEVVVVAKGQLRASGAIKDLKELHETPLDVELLEPSPAFEAAVAGQGGRVVSVESYHYRVVMPGSDAAEMTGRVFQAAVSSKVQVRAVVLAQRSLEDAFMEVVHE